MNINKIAHSNVFSNGIVVVIIINVLLIGVQTSVKNPTIDLIQSFILGIFIIEIFIRWFGRNSTKEYLSQAWNWFDVTIVLIALIPTSIFSNGEIITSLRVLRVFRVLRLFKAFPELQLMIKVLLKSCKSVYYAGLLLTIFMYLYSIIGVTLFKGHSSVETAHTNNLDPFGNIFEAFFSLFRVSTGEDWTDLRYDLLSLNVGISPVVINVYFLSWYVLSAFLLINIVFGAVINNYEVIYATEKNTDEKDQSEQLADQLKCLEAKVDRVYNQLDRDG